MAGRGSLLLLIVSTTERQSWFLVTIVLWSVSIRVHPTCDPFGGELVHFCTGGYHFHRLLVDDQNAPLHLPRRLLVAFDSGTNDIIHDFWIEKKKHDHRLDILMSVTSVTNRTNRRSEYNWHFAQRLIHSWYSLGPNSHSRDLSRRWRGDYRRNGCLKNDSYIISDVSTYSVRQVFSTPWWCG